MNISVTNVSANYYNAQIIHNGSFTIAATGGAAPYSYLITNLPRNFFGILNSNNNGYFGNLPAYNYQALVFDVNKVKIADTVVTVASVYPQPSLNCFLEMPTSCDSANGRIVFSGQGGTPPYTYSIDGGVTFTSSDTFANLATGYYNCLLKDANGMLAFFTTSRCYRGCTGFPGIIDPPYFGPSAFCTFISTVYVSSVSNCNNSGIINIFANSLPPPFVCYPPYYCSMDGVNYLPANTTPFENVVEDSLAPGLYNIYFKDSIGQKQVFSISLAKFCGVQINNIVIDASCQQSDGATTVLATGGKSPYTFTIDGINFQAGNTFSNLAAGTYSFSVKDADGNISTAVATIYNKCPEIFVTGTNETCGQKNGTISSTGIKGTRPYYFSIDGVNFQTDSSFKNLSAGFYKVILKDANNFTDSAFVTIINNCLKVTVTANNETCGSKNGIITATTTGGNQPYTFSIDGVNFQPNGLFVNLTAGSYKLTVKDNTGDTSSAVAVVADEPAPQLSLSKISPSCTNNDGTLTLTATGGSPVIQYSIDSINFQTGNVFQQLAAGIYKPTAKDANGCITSQSFSLNMECPTVTVAVTNETCGRRNASIVASGSGAVLPYTYSLNNGNFQSSSFFSNLSAGKDTVTIKDANGYTNFIAVNIINSCPTVTAVAVDATCSSSNGKITVSGANGIPPYSYSINGTSFQSNTLFDSLAANTYIVTVKDSANLTSTVTVTVNNLAGPLISNIVTTAAGCSNNDGTVTISASGGTAPFQFSIIGNDFKTTGIFTGTSTGTKTAMVKDANGCIASKAATVPLNNTLTIYAGNDTIACQGTSTTLAAQSNGTQFSWMPVTGLDNPASSSTVAKPLINITYFVTAATGICSKTDTVNIMVKPAPIAIATQNSTICFGQDAVLQGSGGIVYSWSPSDYLDNANSANPKVIKPATSITYTLKVNGSNGCQSINDPSMTITVTPPPKLFAGNDTAVAIGQPLQLVAADVNNSGFNQYKWQPFTGLNNAAVFNPVANLTTNAMYVVTASTAAGCTGTDSIQIKVFKKPEIFVATAFAPGGVNHLLHAIPVGIKTFQYFIIYNRWGKEVFHTTNASIGWDGQSQNSGSFVWMAAGIDYNGVSIVRKGTVVLLR